MGKNNDNPQFHVLMPSVATKDVERIRKRIKIAGNTGNKQYSVKFMQKSGIQYCSREETETNWRGIDCDLWIKTSPKWLNCNLAENLDRKRSRQDLENGIKLTIVNHLRLAWKY